MDFNAIIKRVIAIITKPVEEWEVIKNEQMSTSDMYVKYAIFLAAIPAIAGFIGWVAIGRSYGFFTYRMPIANALIWAVMIYVMNLVSPFVLSFIMDALAPSFGAAKDMNRSLKIAIFSSTAAWVAGIFNIIPSLAMIASLGGLYGLYLLYLGIKSLKEPPADKVMGYTIVTLIAAVILFFVIGFIVAAVAIGTPGVVNPLTY